jgi:23S rRNA maturation mini-RNase III
MIDHVVFRMVFDAVADLSDARDVPQGSAVTFAEVCPENGGCVEGMPTLLQLTWGENKLIGYAAGFDTSHDDYGPGEDDSGPMALILSGKPPEEWTAEMLFGSDAGPVEITRNPENAWVKVDWGERRVLAFMDPELTGLERSLGYRFRDRRLLAEATTHSSLLNEPRGADRAANQRLAHLGDAVVELAVREALFKRFPAAAKGDLAAAKVPIVRDSGLAKVACAKEIGEFLDRGRGRPQAADNDTILAEAFEALVGAVYLDSDLEEAARIVDRDRTASLGVNGSAAAPWTQHGARGLLGAGPAGKVNGDGRCPAFLASRPSSFFFRENVVIGTLLLADTQHFRLLFGTTKSTLEIRTVFCRRGVACLPTSTKASTSMSRPMRRESSDVLGA